MGRLGITDYGRNATANGQSGPTAIAVWQRDRRISHVELREQRDLDRELRQRHGRSCAGRRAFWLSGQRERDR